VRLVERLPRRAVLPDRRPIKTCVSDGDCGTGAVCNDEKKCYAACTTTADCTRGMPYTCVGTAPRKFCDAPSPGDGGSDGT
jgi:hypothetical protein